MSKENSVTRYDDPTSISCKLQFLALSLNYLHEWDMSINSKECTGLNTILSEIADVVRTFEKGET